MSTILKKSSAQVELEDVLAQMQAIIDRAKEESADGGEKGRDLTPAESAQVEELAEKAQELRATIERQAKGDALFAALNAGYQGEEDPGHSGAFESIRPVVGSKGHVALSGVRAKQTMRGIIGQRNIKSLIASGSSGYGIAMDPDPIADGRVPTTVLEALTTVIRDGGPFNYLRQTVRDNKAAIVAPGGLKPTSEISVQTIENQLQVFAHLSEYVDMYLLEDNTALQQFVSTQLLYMLSEAVEDEVLNGDATTGHLRGILATSGVQTQAFATDAVTTLRLAALKLENAGHAADLFVVNSTDWAEIETQRATSGSFDLGGPVDRATQKLWGTQVVTSTRIAAGTALALDREALAVDSDGRVDVQWDSATGFDRNQVRARVEGRFGLSVFQPAGVVKATVTD